MIMNRSFKYGCEEITHDEALCKPSSRHEHAGLRSAFGVLQCPHLMRRSNPIKRELASANVWLVGLLVVLLLVLTVHSGAHGNHAGPNHFCAACLIAHGGVIADGAVGTVVFVSHAASDLTHVGEVLPASILDLRLAPGRAPPA